MASKSAKDMGFVELDILVNCGSASYGELTSTFSLILNVVPCKQKVANVTPRVLLPSDQDSILAFAKDRQRTLEGDGPSAEIASWSARWRSESLEHYLKLGWSFGCAEQDKWRGFILAQPLLFYRGLTQTLWIEDIQSVDMPTSLLLVDTVYKWARDKHFQCVLTEENESTRFIKENWPQAKSSDNLIELKSARFTR